MKSPTQSTIDAWMESIQKQGYRRIKLRALLKAFGVQKRGPALIEQVNEFLEAVELRGRPRPMAVQWELANKLDDAVRIVPLLVATTKRSIKEKKVATVKQKSRSTKQKQPDVQTKIVRAISIRQPYVEAILLGKKTIEYRTRKTNIRERVYLYAGKNPGESVYGLKAGDYPTGFIVGSVEIVDCTGVDGDYEIHLANPKRLKTFLKPKNQPQPMFWRPEFDRGKDA